MTKKFFLFAAVLDLFLGCTSIPDDLRDEANGKLKYSYCVLVEQQICLSGPFTSCANGGLLSNDCPYGTQRSSSSAWSNILSSSSYSPSTLSYQGQIYKTVKIGTQTWMAENLNYNVSGSVCYNNNSSYCVTYGRLYNWATAMSLNSICNSSACTSQVQSKHQGICPSGWHIPSNEDWDKLYRYVDGTNGTSSPYDSPTAGKHLKAKTGWNSSGNGLDTYGFSALPGGYGNSGGSFYSVGGYGLWWSSSEYNSYYACSRYMLYGYENAYWYNYSKSFLRSVRCLQD